MMDIKIEFEHKQFEPMQIRPGVMIKAYTYCIVNI
jgi:hypothetical protein